MGHDEVAEKHGFMANFLPGADQNGAVTGMEYYRSDERGEYIRDKDDNPIPHGDVNYWASDQNPFLKFLYHWVPGIKSFSEIHDMEMKVVDGKYESSKPPTWVPVVTILPSFLYSFVHAGGSTLDVTNWSKNWDNFIHESYKIRQIKQSGNK